MRLRTLLGAACVVIAATASCVSAVAQDSVMERPADIRAGSCASVGEVVTPLAPLVVPHGETVGQEGASPVEQSVTELPLLLTDLLSENSAIAVHASPDAVGTPIACGEIGGALAADGSLSVGLQAMSAVNASAPMRSWTTATMSMPVWMVRAMTWTELTRRMAVLPQMAWGTEKLDLPPMQQDGRTDLTRPNRRTPPEGSLDHRLTQEPTGWSTARVVTACR